MSRCAQTPDRVWQTVRCFPGGLGCCLLGLALSCAAPVYALRLEPGIGLGLEQTSNAALTPQQPRSDTILMSYVGGNLTHVDGHLDTTVSATLNKHDYLQNTFADRRYFKLDAVANWDVRPRELQWHLRNRYFQRPVTTEDSATPDNVQDSNVFSLDGLWRIPASGISTYTLQPEVRRYYYEQQNTDNVQLSLTGRWIYPLHRLTGVGIDLGFRQVDYQQAGVADTRFSRAHLSINAVRPRSHIDISLGVTRVQRNTGSSAGFSGSLEWLFDLTHASRVKTVVSSEITDSSSGSTRIQTDAQGETQTIQVTTDVIRNKRLSLSYLHEDGLARSRLWLDLREILYSDSPNDRKVARLGAELEYPVSPVLVGGVYSRYVRTRLVEQFRTDRLLNVGVHIKYRHTPRLKSSLDLRYQDKQSSNASRTYQDTVIYYEMVYGFGGVYRRTRGG